MQAAAGGYEVQFTPTVPFPNSAAVQWWFSGVLDVDGNAFNGDSGYFYIAPAVNLAAAPAVVAVSPQSYSSSVPVNSQFDIEYNLPIDGATLSGNVYFNSGRALTATVLSAPQNNIIRVQPSAAIPPLTTDYLCANSNVKGTNGKTSTSNCWDVTNFPTTASSTPDTTSGTVKIGPPDGTVNVGTNAYIRLVFSKPVDITSINATTVQVTAGGNPIDGTWSWVYSGNDVGGAQYSPVNPLPASSTIKVSLNACRYLLDYAGNQFSASP